MATSLFAFAALARAGYVDGPPPAHTGGFGEPSCHQCHFDGPVNDPAGALALAGLPASYEPGETYTLAITLARPGLGRGGFQLAARFSTGEHEGRQAGELRPLDQRTALTRSGEAGVEYLHHVGAGTARTAPDTARWTVAWTAPRAGGADVAFHLAANAANDDASEFGDHIYTLEAASRAP